MDALRSLSASIERELNDLHAADGVPPVDLVRTGDAASEFDLVVSLPGVRCHDLLAVVPRALDRMPAEAFLAWWERRDQNVGAVAVAVSEAGRWRIVRVRLQGASGASPGPRRLLPRRRGRKRSGSAPGFVVAVYGVDGSGKGTVVRSLVQTLAPAFTGVEQWHLLQWQQPGVEYAPVTDPHGQPPRSVVSSAIKVVWYLAYAWIARTPRVMAARRKGRFVVIDRDMADPWLDPRRYRIRLPDRAVALLERFGPKPDRALVLDADVSDVMARTGELRPELAAPLLRRYRAFAASSDATVKVDARPPAKEVGFAACRLVLAHLDARARAHLGATPGPAQPWRGTKNASTR